MIRDLWGLEAEGGVDLRPGVGRQADGRAWYMVRSNAEYTGSSSTDSLVKSISYTDADGKRVTYTPTLRH